MVSVFFRFHGFAACVCITFDFFSIFFSWCGSTEAMLVTTNKVS